MYYVDSISLGGIVTVRDKLLKLQSEGHKVLRLESGDPSFPIAIHIQEALGRAVYDGHTHYVAGAGIPSLREAAYEKMCTENKLPLENSNQVFITNGAMNGLYVVLRSLVVEGDEVLVPDPTWTETADIVTLSGGKVVRYQVDVDVDELESRVTPKTKAIILNSPHNPTGTVLSTEKLLDILRVADSFGLVVVSDEAYEHIIYDGKKHVSIGSLADKFTTVISIYSMSKSYAMSGLRLGYVAVPDKKLAERVSKFLRCTINGVNSATQHAGVAALKGPQQQVSDMLQVYQQRRDILMEGLNKVDFLEPINPEGAFYAWAKIKYGFKNAWEATETLIDKIAVGSAPGDVFGPGGSMYIRFAFSCSTDQIVEAANRLQLLTV